MTLNLCCRILKKRKISYKEKEFDPKYYYIILKK